RSDRAQSSPASLRFGRTDCSRCVQYASVFAATGHYAHRPMLLCVVKRFVRRCGQTSDGPLVCTVLPEDASIGRCNAKHTAAAVDRRRDMHIQMSVDSTRHQARGFYDGHRHPFSAQDVKGWHARPGKETVTSPLQRTASSVTLRNGACPIPTTQVDRQASDPVLMHNK